MLLGYAFHFLFLKRENDIKFRMKCKNSLRLHLKEMNINFLLPPILKILKVYFTEIRSVHTFCKRVPYPSYKIYYQLKEILEVNPNEH